MFIHTQEDALDALSDILKLPERREQLIHATINIVLCMNPEPRALMADCQALLIEGGLEMLRQKRRDLLDSIENLPIVIMDPEEDRAFESAASALDALRLSKVAYEVFPSLEKKHEPWKVARALLGNEAHFQEQLAAGICARDLRSDTEAAGGELDRLIQACEPEWAGRAQGLRNACREVLKEAVLSGDAQVDEESDLVFGIFATADDRARELLSAIDRDPHLAVQLIARTYSFIEALRTVQGKA